MQFVPFLSTACARFARLPLNCSIMILFKGLNGGVILKKLILKCRYLLASLALLSAISSANQACSWFTYQSELPDSVRKLRKF